MDNGAIIITGMMGYGKSTRAAHIINDYVKRNNRHALVLDPNGSFPIPLETSKKIIHKTIDLSSDETKQLLACLPTKTNGAIVFDDTNLFTRYSEPDLIKIIIKSRHNNVLAIFIYHSLNQVHLRLWENAKRIYIFRDNSNWVKIKNRISHAITESHHTKALALKKYEYLQIDLL